jgi:hypothetical protein
VCVCVCVCVVCVCVWCVCVCVCVCRVCVFRGGEGGVSLCVGVFVQGKKGGEG